MPVKSNNSGSDLAVSKYKGLISTIETLLLDAKSKVVKTVNQTMVYTYWHIGRYIVEYEQGGEQKSEYGRALLKKLSFDLTKSFGRGYSYRNLRQMRQFYISFPIWQTVSANSNNPIIPSVMAQSENSIWPTLSAKSKSQKGQTMPAQS